MAGYSGTPLDRKLGIKPGSVVYALDPPGDYKKLLGPLPAGAKVVILDLPDSPGPALADSFGANGLFTAADVGSGEQVERAVAQATSRFGAVHIAINCAGIGKAPRSRLANTERASPTRTV